MKMKNEDELQNAAQTAENGGSTVQEEANSYETLMARLAQKADENATAILPARVREVKAGGGSRTYNHDPKRPMKAYDAKNGSHELSLVKRTDKDTGVFITNFRSIEKGIGLLFHRHKQGEQVNFVLNNGKVLTGHIVMNKNLRGFYFPKRNCENLVELPANTKAEVPFIALSILVG
jgi:hypothetical protein